MPTAPNGAYPEVNPFAIVIKSGTTPQWLTANHSPVRPNPLITSRASRMEFSTNETNGGEIKIYTISGRLVNRIAINAGQPQASWDLDNMYGNTIKSGIYIYAVTDSEGKTKTGKLAITN